MFPPVAPSRTSSTVSRASAPTRRSGQHSPPAGTSPRTDAPISFHLRPGVRFHDGTLLHASDVVHSFTRVLDPANKSGPALAALSDRRRTRLRRREGHHVAGLDVVDDSTVRIALDTALAIFPKLLAMPVASVVPRENLRGFRRASDRHRAVDARVVAARRLRAARAEPRVLRRRARSSIRSMIRIIPEPSTAVAEFESGNVDLLYVPEAEPRAGSRPTKRRRSSPRRPRSASGTSRSTRRAARSRMCACDRRSTTPSTSARSSTSSCGGRGHARGRRHPAHARRRRHRRARRTRYDPAAARKLLAAAGYAKGFDIELWLPQDPAFARVAESIQSYLAAVGVRAKLVQRESAAAREASRNGQTRHVREGLVRRLSGRREFSVSAAARRESRRRRQRVVLRESDVRPHRRRSRAPSRIRAQARRALSPGRFARVRRCANDLSLLLQRALRGAAVGEGLHRADDLQWPEVRWT